jgi:hypothetical protein
MMVIAGQMVEAGFGDATSGVDVIGLVMIGVLLVGVYAMGHAHGSDTAVLERKCPNCGADTPEMS